MKLERISKAFETPGMVLLCSSTDWWNNCLDNTKTFNIEIFLGKIGPIVFLNLLSWNQMLVKGIKSVFNYHVTALQ